MQRLLILIYGVISYAFGMSVILYMIGFVSGVVVPKNIDDGAVVSVVEAVLVDLALIALFGVSHSVMARPAFKEKLTKIIPQAAERSTFVLTANIAFAILYWQWRPIKFVLWHSEPPLSTLLFSVSMVGWIIVNWSTFLIDHFDLFGIRQVWLNFKGIDYFQRPFVVRGLYKFVRHPLMLGFLIAFWVAPTMSAGHLLFTLSMTAYILIGTYHEERDLERSFGDGYANYKKETSMIIPGLK